MQGIIKVIGVGRIKISDILGYSGKSSYLCSVETYSAEAAAAQPRRNPFCGSIAIEGRQDMIANIGYYKRRYEGTVFF